MGSAGEATAIRQTQDALDDLSRLLAGRPDGVPYGSARDLTTLAASESVLARLESGISMWLAFEGREVRKERAAAEGLTKRLVTVMVLLLAGLAVVAVGGWIAVERRRRRVVQALERRRLERAAFLDAMRDGMVAITRGGAVSEANDMFLSQSGRARDDVVALPSLLPIWAVEHRDRIERLVGRALAGEPGEVDAEILRPDDGRVAVTASIAPRRAATGGGRRRRRHDNPRCNGEAAREAARLLGATTGVVMRFRGDEAATIVRWWNDPALEGDAGPTIENLHLSADTPMARVHRSGGAERVDDFASLPSEEAKRIAARFRGSVAAPVRVGGRLWGAVSAMSVGHAVLDPTAEDDLSRFAELVGIAVSNAETRSRLSARATVDTVTGLANHRAFHDRLGAEIGRARLHGRDMSLAVIDIDHFRDVNNRFGHLTGDEVLAEMGRRLGAQVGAGELAARASVARSSL